MHRLIADCPAKISVLTPYVFLIKTKITVEN